MYTRKLFFVIGMTLALIGASVCQSRCGFNTLTGFTGDLTHAGDASRMQFGTLALYFEHEPIVNYIPSRNKHDSLVFFFPHVIMPSSVYSALSHAFRTKKNDRITIQCHRVHKPIAGMELVIYYDPETVIVDKKVVRSSRLEPGVLFSFYNKQLVNILKNQPKGVLNISYRYRKLNRVCFLNA